MKYNKYEYEKDNAPVARVEVVKIISEHKKIKTFNPSSGLAVKRPTHGNRRVQAIVRLQNGELVTRHLDVAKQ